MGRGLHKEALGAQERGDFQLALEKSDAALIAYQKDNDDLGFSEIQAMRFLTLKHLADKTGDNRFLVLAKFSAMGSVELAERSGNPETLTIPLFNLAKVREALGEFKEAVEVYAKAVENLKRGPEMYKNREAILNDMKVHMGVCAYKAGNQTGLTDAESALLELANSEEEDSYSKNVWLSGGHMKIAEAVSATNRPLAKEHLDKARKIIEGDDRLIIRKEQLKKLCDSMKI